MSNRIPKSIQAILKRAEELRDQAAQQQAVEDEEKAAELKQQRDREWNTLWAECGPQLPKEIRRFARQPEVEINFRLDWHSRAIPFQINGLAPFIAIFERAGQGEGVHLELASYRCARPVTTGYDEPGEIVWDWHDGYQIDAKPGHALEAIILKAHELVNEFQSMQRNEEKVTRKDAARKAETEQRQAQERDEETRLFKLIKSDPVSLILMKALVLIQQERSDFNSQIEQATWSAENIENRLTEKLDHVRQLADDAERRAENEQRRADDAEDELAKAKKKHSQGL